MELLERVFNGNIKEAFEEFFEEKSGDFVILNEELEEYEDETFQEVEKLGEIEGLKLGVFLIKLEKIEETSSKKKQFEFAKKLLKELDYEAGIFIFYDENYNFRFSFVFKEYIGTKEQYSPFKRYTYFVSKDKTNKTFKIQLSKADFSSIESIKEAFSISEVTKEFYEKYRNLFEMLKETLIKSHGNILGLENKKIEIFAKKLLGRIIFLYFLQKKGWLGVDKEGKWGEGRKDFLYYYFKKAEKEDKNFYEDYLKKIFFEALNMKRENDYFEELDCKIPFLNGGLFEKDGLDKELLYLDNALFKKIFNVFNEYNFTIIEDSPDDKEVAIDPEMMGRVFENLLDENYRKGKGAFYTPREIVHYMCQQTIIDNLLNYFDDKEAITNLIIKKETDNKYIKKHGKEIKEKLLSLKILDPAIGSGAFPMGLLHEIVSTLLALDKTMSEKEIAKLKREVIENCIYGIDIDYSAVEIAKLRFWLSLVVDEEEPTPLPNLYYKIMVGNSLFESIYGIDLLQKEGLFDEKEEQIEKIQILIHKFFNEYEKEKKETLKRQIEQEIDNLLEKEINKQEEQLSSQLKNLNLFNQNKKTIENIELTNNILTILHKIKKRPTSELFFYKIYFADVLYNGGFDIVIGNPPYIRQEKIKEIKERLQKEEFYNPITGKKEKYECFSGTADIYIYFFEKGFRLLSQNGILSFITSNKYTRAKYGAKFREFLLKNADIKEYIDFNGVKVFESATVDTAILSFSRKKEQNPLILYCNVKDDFKRDQNLFYYVQQNGFLYPQNNLTKDAFTFLSPKELEIKKRIEEIGTPLKEWDVKINFGIKTGFNEAFIIDKDTKDKLIKEDPKSAEIIKPLLRGRDIKKYSYEFANLYIIIAKYQSNKYLKKDYPAIYNHLLTYKDKLSKRGQCTNRGGKGQHHWLELDNNPTDDYFGQFEREKIIFSRIVKQPQFHYDTEKFYIEATGYILSGNNLKYLIAFLNSDFIYQIFYRFYSGGGVDGEIKKNKLELLPIPKISKEKQKPFEKLVDIIIELNKQKDVKAKFFEEVIDIMVYELYFEKELKEENFDIIETVSKDLENFTSPELFEKWNDRKHKVKKAIEFIDTLDIVKTIKGMM